MEYLDLDWGNATPEGYDVEKHEALHVLNVNFIGEENRNRVVKFVIGRVLHFHRHLPKASSQRVRFDLRGQLISNKSLKLARQAIVEEAARHSVNVSVEFFDGLTMAYNFTAQKPGEQDLRVLHQALSRFVLFEFFPIEVGEQLLTLGISIPFKSVDDPRFENELEEVMRYFVLEREFDVTDLFTGNAVTTSNLSRLAKQISG